MPNNDPVALILPVEQEAVAGSIVKLDGRSSVDPEDSALTFTWTFTQVPIGSQVERFGFADLESDSSIVTFAPDITGTYKIQLVVSDGVNESSPVEAVVDCRRILVPYHQGITPDASFIWNYLSDFWSKVDGRKKFEVFWSAAIQLAASELLKLYQYDYNKSIRDIQEVFQRRWISFAPSLELDRSLHKFILADDLAGSTGSTKVLNPLTGVPAASQPASVNLLTVSASEADFITTPFGSKLKMGKVLALGDRGFTHLRSAAINASLASGFGSVELASPLYPFRLPIDMAEPSGLEGYSPPGPAEFIGSGFTSEMVDQHLVIEEGPNAGTYLIVEVLSDHAVKITNLDGTGPDLVDDGGLENLGGISGWQLQPTTTSPSARHSAGICHIPGLGVCMIGGCITNNISVMASANSLGDPVADGPGGTSCAMWVFADSDWYNWSEENDQYFPLGNFPTFTYDPIAEKALYIPGSMGDQTVQPMWCEFDGTTVTTYNDPGSFDPAGELDGTRKTAFMNRATFDPVMQKIVVQNGQGQDKGFGSSQTGSTPGGHAKLWSYDFDTHTFDIVMTDNEFANGAPTGIYPHICFDGVRVMSLGGWSEAERICYIAPDTEDGWIDVGDAPTGGAMIASVYHPVRNTAIFKVAGETWEFDGEDETFTQLVLSDEGPASIEKHSPAMAYEEESDRLVLFGGQNVSGNVSNATYVTEGGSTGARRYSVQFAGGSARSIFFADLPQIPGQLVGQNWRLSSTLISSQYDFEEEGVSPEDLLEIEIVSVATGLLTTIYGQITAVDRNRAGFVLNLDDLEDGESAGWFSTTTQINLATDLQVRGLSLDVAGDLVYLHDSSLIRTTISSFKFKRQYLEIELTPDSEIDIGAGFTIRARPVKIIRHSKIRLNENIVSIPVLQEYIRHPDTSTVDDEVSIIVEGGVFPATRSPYLLVENLDYLIDDDAAITGSCNVEQGSDEIEIPYGDLFDRKIKGHDTITIQDGAVETTYEIRQIIDAETLKVYPTPSADLETVPFRIQRRVAGNYLRFVNDVFTKTKVAPERLWAEVVYFDNSDVVEANFGVLVGLTREQLDQTAAEVPYRSAVAGLMYALATGPTISNLALAAQILLGLPFTQNAGVIREINPDYKKREDGSPFYGRILVDGRDKQGNPTGLTNIYFYPHGRQIEISANVWEPAEPDFSGLGINPETDEEFAVGDEVAQFVQLSKGVQIQEYLETPDWTDLLVAQGHFQSVLQRYHAFQLIVNAELISGADIDLAAQFIKKAKPHYLHLTAALIKGFEDEVEVEDEFYFQQFWNFFDNASLSMPSALMLDSNDLNRSILTYEGEHFVRYLTGNDLITTKDSLEMTSSAGGFVDPGAGENHDIPFLRPWDLLVIRSGSNAGHYRLTEISDDTTLVVAAGSYEFETLSSQEFALYKAIRNPIWSGLVDITNGDPDVQCWESMSVPAGLHSAGVAVGDRLVFFDGAVVSTRVYTVTKVTPDDTNPEIKISPDPEEATDQYTAWVIREPLITRNLVEPFDVGEGATVQQSLLVDTTSGDQFVPWSSSMTDPENWLNTCLVRPGDTLVIGDEYLLVIANDYESKGLWVSPAPGATDTEVSCSVIRQHAPTTTVSVDLLQKIPEDSIQLDLLLSEDEATDRLVTANGSPDVETADELDFTTLGVLPGDHLLILDGADSTRDVGYGPGAFPILKYNSATSLKLTEDLTEDNAAPGIPYGIRRNRPQC